MKTRNDAGIGQVIDEGNGLVTVVVCARVDGCIPRGVMAVHSTYGH